MDRVKTLSIATLSVVPVNDPLAPLQLLHADVTERGKGLRVCVQVRNESPGVVHGVQISGSIRDRSQSLTVFFTGATPTAGQESGVAPDGEFSACSSVPGVVIHDDAVIQITIK